MSTSGKVTDPRTGTNYYHDLGTGNLHHWDKNAATGQGAVVGNNFFQWGATQNKLQARLAAGGLIDKTRPNMLAAGLRPFDVGTYAAPANAAPAHGGGSIAQTLPAVAGAFGANRDHAPSSLSLEQRNLVGGIPGLAATHAQAQGAAIGIPNATMHIAHSPTFGARQNTWDTEHPAYHGLIYPTLDLTVAQNRMRQMGAYRKMYRTNVKMNQLIGPGRGVNPAQAGETHTHVPGGGGYGSFTYHTVANKTQGEVTRDEFMSRL